jgi:AraC-like DNA-binding protein
MQPGTPHLFSMTRPFEAERGGGPRVDWHSVFIARDALPELEAAFSAAEFGPVRSPFAPLLTNFLATLPEMIDAMSLEDLPHLAATTRALVAAVFSRAGGEHPVMPQVAALQLARVKRLVRENIGAATLGPARLCRLAGMSRSQLYRLFEPLGGVARHIQRERLALAHRLLCDPAERRDVAQIAEAAGFFDPSSFSRAFRREFGMAPRDLRQEAMAGRGAVAAPVSRPVSGARSLLAELRRL